MIGEKSRTGALSFDFSILEGKNEVRNPTGVGRDQSAGTGKGLHEAEKKVRDIKN